MDSNAAFSEFEEQALAAVTAAQDLKALEAIRIEFLGKKHGRLRDLQSLLGKVAPQERPRVGKRFNEVRTSVTAALESRQREFSQPQTRLTQLDISLPGTPLRLGSLHPLTQTIEEFKNIISRFGFSVADGPEIEDEYHNFEALNIPFDHPARDPLDNFYLATALNSGAEKEQGASALLRSQTSTVQIRVMENVQPPIRIVSLGRVYRPDTMDATHSCMFHQMEGLMVGDSVTMAELKTVLRLFARAYLGHDVHIRFRPSFFPFTEPSVEVDMSWKGEWLELGGAGMVDPRVLTAVGYDPERFSGFAFGLGIERFCMRRHQITDIRRFFENNVQFLQQF